jgi:hypothetical protein
MHKTPTKEQIRETADLVRKALKLGKGNTFCQCAKASFALHAALSRKFPRQRFSLHMYNDIFCGHCLVAARLGGERHAIDITFTQFDNKAPDVIVEPYAEYLARLRKKAFGGGRIEARKTTSSRHFRQYFLRNWNEQRPSKALVRMFAGPRPIV